MSNTGKTELTATRDEVTRILSRIVNEITTGSLHVQEGDETTVIEIPEEVTLEIELETEDDERSLELELQWSCEETAIDEPINAPINALLEDSDRTVHIGGSGSGERLARFELFRDNNEEWRWRLRHRNGNIIATSGEGYTRKHNAHRGLRSVMQNAPNATTRETPSFSRRNSVTSSISKFNIVDNAPEFSAVGHAVFAQVVERPLLRSHGIGLWVVRPIVIDAGGLVSFF